MIGKWAIPFMFRDKQQRGRNIAGELWSVTPDCLEALDVLEGVSKGG